MSDSTMINLLYVSSDVSSVHLNLLEALKQKNIDPVLFSYTTGRRKKALDSYEKTIVCQGKSIFRGPLFYCARLRHAAKRYLRMRQLPKADLLHGNMLFGDGFVCRYIAGKKHIPYIVSVRNTDFNLWFLWKLPWIKSMGMKNLLEAAAVICLSEPYRDELLRRIPAGYREEIRAKIRIVPNGINDYWLQNRFSEKRTLGTELRLVTAGRIEKNKNQVRVAQAAQLLRKETGYAIHYTVIGDCCDETMKTALEQYEFVTIKPHMPKEELIHEFLQSDIFVMPSHTETFGLVYAEAMTQGLPVVYTAGQGFDRQFEDGTVGYPVDAMDPSDIADGIRMIAENYETISANAVMCSERFCRSGIALELKRIYGDSIGKCD